MKIINSVRFDVCKRRKVKREFDVVRVRENERTTETFHILSKTRRPKVMHSVTDVLLDKRKLRMMFQVASQLLSLIILRSDLPKDPQSIALVALIALLACVSVLHDGRCSYLGRCGFHRSKTAAMSITCTSCRLTNLMLLAVLGADDPCLSTLTPIAENRFRRHLLFHTFKAEKQRVIVSNRTSTFCIAQPKVNLYEPFRISQILVLWASFFCRSLTYYSRSFSSLVST